MPLYRVYRILGRDYRDFFVAMEVGKEDIAPELEPKVIAQRTTRAQNKTQAITRVRKEIEE